MQYVLLIYDDPTVWAKVPPEDYPKLYEEYGAIAKLPSTKGGAQLQPVDTARSVREEIAARILSARMGGTVEIRPVVER